MIKYLIFPIPVGLIEVEASSPAAARNKYRKQIPDHSEEELIIVLSSHARITSIDLIVPLCKCGIMRIK